MNSRDDNPKQLPVAELARIDDLCLEFEQKLVNGETPAIEQYLEKLGGCEALQSELLAELIGLEIEFHARKGKSTNRTEYERRFPEESIAVGSAFRSRKTVNTGVISKRIGLGNAPPVENLKVESNYQITRFHARGGLGAVYVANDTQLSREVAVKFSRIRDMDEPQRRRFEREANITGRLQHPGIVPVHAIKSSENAPPCYVMRFVEGDTLQQSVQLFHQETAKENRNRFSSLRFRQLLQRLISICNTVSYAHEQRVIHRDIKPSNIMLGQHGETLLLDWGLAKLIDQDVPEDDDETMLAGTNSGCSAETLPGQIMGTPAFASPEQITGDLEQHNEQSDVYSLGATLYFLLTGRRPIQSESMDRLPTSEEIRNLKPTREIDPLIPRGLDAICQKAMAFAASDRYKSAEIMADELERYLADEPIAVLVDPWVRRGQRWFRKNPGYLAAMVAGVAVGVGGLMIGSTILGQKNKTLNYLNTSLKKTNQELQDANQTVLAAQDQTLASLRQMTNKVVATMMARQVDLGNDDRKFLEYVMSSYESFANLQGDDQRSREIRAEGFLQVGAILNVLGRYPESIDTLQKSLKLCSVNEFDGEIPSQAINFISARALALLGELSKRNKDDENSKRQLTEAIHQLSKAREVAEYKDEARKLLGKAQAKLGELLCKSNDLTGSRKCYANSLAIWNELNAEYPANTEFQYLTAFYYLSHAQTFNQLRSANETELEIRKAIKIYDSLIEQNDDDPKIRFDRAVAQVLLARTLERLRQYTSAIDCLQLAANDFEELALQFPSVNRYPISIGDTYGRLAKLYSTNGKLEESETAFDTSLKVYGALYEDDPEAKVVRWEYFKNRMNYAIFLDGCLKDLAKSEENLLACVEMATNWTEAEDTLKSRTTLGDALNALAAVLEKQSRLEDAVAMRHRAIDSVVKFGEACENDRQAAEMLWTARFGLAMLRVKQQKLAEAVPELDRLLEMNNATDKEFLRSIRAVCLAGSNTEEGLKEIANMLEENPQDPRVVYNLACASALASGMVSDDGEVATLEKQAIELLYKANEMGYFKKPGKIAALNTHESFDSMREKADFVEFLSNLNSSIE